MRPPAGAAHTPVVYTASFGGLDDVRAPAPQPNPMRFVCFVSDDSERPGWETIKVTSLPTDSRRASRAIKVFPHLLFPDHSTSIWVDASARIVGDVSLFPDYVSDESPIAVMPHAERHDVYEEERICQLLAKDDRKLMSGQVSRYRKEGLPKKSGLIQSGLIVRAHNSPACKRFMTAWWTEIEEWSVRDQLSFPYVAWKLGFNLALLPRSFASEPHLYFSEHRKHIVYDARGLAKVPLRYWPLVNLVFRARDKLLLLLGRI